MRSSSAVPIQPSGWQQHVGQTLRGCPLRQDDLTDESPHRVARGLIQKAFRSEPISNFEAAVLIEPRLAEESASERLTYDSETLPRRSFYRLIAACVWLVAFLIAWPSATALAQSTRSFPAIVPEGEHIPGAQEALRMPKPKGQASCIAISPDACLVALGSEDGTVRLWDLQFGKLAQWFEGHKSVVNSVSFSPDGKQIVSGSEDNTIKLWDAATGQETLTPVL